MSAVSDDDAEIQRGDGRSSCRSGRREPCRAEMSTRIGIPAPQTGLGGTIPRSREVVSVEEGRALLRAGNASRPRPRTARYELTLLHQIALVPLPVPVLEHQGIPGRKFRFDLCWPDRRLALEIDGAVWVNGRHSRGSGVQTDCEKFSLAAAHGWRVMRVTPDMVRSGKALRLVQFALVGEDVQAKQAKDRRR